MTIGPNRFCDECGAANRSTGKFCVACGKPLSVYTGEDCNIYANQFAGVQVKTGGNPLMQYCKIHDGQTSGIYVHEQGEGTFEDCETFTNKISGLYVGIGYYPLVRRCRFRDGEERER